MADVQYRFDDRVVFVTGATGGMGHAITASFVRAGAAVLMADVIAWLSSSASSFTLGHALAVDAGYLAR